MARAHIAESTTYKSLVSSISALVGTLALYTHSDLQTAVGNRGNTILQLLKHLEPRTTYTFSASFQAPSAGFKYCDVYVYMGRNVTTRRVVSSQLFTFGEWTSVTDTYSPKRPDETLNIIAYCDSENSSVTGRLWIDDVIFAGRGFC